MHVAEADRALYHAALAHAANHLVTILGQSQQMLASIGIEDPARYMGPLVRAAVDNALASGEGALTGPVARGDAGTVKAHLQALNEYSEHEKQVILQTLMPLWHTQPQKERIIEVVKR